MGLIDEPVITITGLLASLIRAQAEKNNISPQQMVWLMADWSGMTADVSASRKAPERPKLRIVS